MYDEHVPQNRVTWDGWASNYVATGRRNWAADQVSWGNFSVPEDDLCLLPDNLSDMETIELGCGTGYVSAWLMRRGAHPVSIDNSPAQLATARACQTEFGLQFPVHLGNAEATPFDDASFDFAVSEYGASIWCDPYLWIPEAARLLRPDGQLVFLCNSQLLMLCTDEVGNEEVPLSDRLLRSAFDMHRSA